MNLTSALLSLLPGGPGIIAFVGAGGKTSALFGLARQLEVQGYRVLITSTTHLLDPRGEPFRPAFDLILRPDMEGPLESVPVPEGRPGLTVLMSREAKPTAKLKGIHPSWFTVLRKSWDFILVEADGSMGLPVKAPEAHEPVLPCGTDLVVGVMGLDCLGRPMDGRTVHRPERFSAVTGCTDGAPIAWEHLVALTRHPEGLFKQAEGPRVILLNKTDRAPFIPAGPELTQLPADLILMGSLEPSEQLLDIQRGTRS